MADKIDESDEFETTGQPKSSGKAWSFMDRRTVIGRSAAVLGGLFAGQLLPAGKAEAQAENKTRSNNASRNNEFLFTAVGELMPVRPFSMQTEPEFLDVIKLLRESDLTYGHLEMNLADDDEVSWAARGSSGGAGYLIADAKLADEIKWAGIDALSLAMNHSYDWGAEGMLATKKNCQRAGIAVAGTGRDLEEATEPAYFEKDKARVALVSCASGNSPFEWAGYGKGKIPGRPGVNQLRLKKLFMVDKSTADQLKEAGRKLGSLSAAAAERKEFNITPGAISGSNGFSGSAFLESDKFDITTENHPGDLKRILRSVDEAKKMADFVMVAHHQSVSEKSRGEDPTRSSADFARKAIDAGADVYLGHGWHTALGIEVYKGKPIIHGMGNFFWQSDYIPRKPADQYESYDQDMDLLTTLNPATGNFHPEGNEHWGYSAVYQFKFVDKKLAEIRLHPIEMGYDFSAGGQGKVYRTIGRGSYKYLDGSPRLAYGANGQWILKRLQHLCELRGTKLEIAGNMGIVKVSATAADRPS
jgi:poly-gamma-glutamate synthesis protein (capsule biosynthesis protein)